MNEPDLKKLFLHSTPLIDVRAPIEFKMGHLPGSVNLPILSDEERHLVGTCYKHQGQDEAMKLGHQLVSGTIKTDRIRAWIDFIEKHPTAEVICARGGLRSQLACQWISETGIKRVPIHGGYKRLRQFFLTQLTEASLPQLICLGGLTGSGKTRLLVTLPKHLDIEGEGNHRGSTFGFLGEQPSQVTFENRLILGLLKNSSQMIVEDESSNLGKLTLPPRLYQTMQTSSLVILEASIEERVKNIFEDYVLNAKADFFISATLRLSKWLGATKTATLTQKIQNAFDSEDEGHQLISNHYDWITSLLSDYYDIFYNRSLSKQKDLVIFKGDKKAVSEWWLNHIKGLSP